MGDIHYLIPAPSDRELQELYEALTPQIVQEFNSNTGRFKMIQHLPAVSERYINKIQLRQEVQKVLCRIYGRINS